MLKPRKYFIVSLYFIRKSQ